MKSPLHNAPSLHTHKHSHCVHARARAHARVHESGLMTAEVTHICMCLFSFVYLCSFLCAFFASGLSQPAVAGERKKFAKRLGIAEMLGRRMTMEDTVTASLGVRWGRGYVGLIFFFAFFRSLFIYFFFYFCVCWRVICRAGVAGMAVATAFCSFFFLLILENSFFLC